MTDSKKTILRVVIVAIIVLLFVVKALVTGAHHWRINDAIYLYRMECIANHVEREVGQDDMEGFYETYFRLWDWSDKRIMRREDYAKIEKYIGQKSLSDAFMEYME